MSTTVSMWLGIAFVVLAVVAVLLQAWLWNPKYWDEEKKVSHAPRLWMNVHRVVGFAFLAIYLVMMVEMVPRLWEYQFELPARTVMHAVAAIILGVLLLTKVLILRFFRHFEESMPTIGMGILLCTIVLGTLSLPFAIRAHDIEGLTLDEDNVARTQRLLAELDLGDTTAEELITPMAFATGRTVLVEKCVPCHDIRTILQRPRTASSWFSVVERMQEKPVIAEPITDRDVLLVTSYLVAVTPDIQRSSRRLRDEQREREAVGQAMATPEEPEPAAADAELPDGAVPQPPPVQPVDEAQGRALLERRCTDCHGLTEVTEFGGADVDGWGEVIRRMVIVEAAEIEPDEAELLKRYLAETYPPQ